MENGTTGIEQIYRHHHETRRGDGFVMLGEERGSFLKRCVGTGKNVLDVGCRDGALTAWYREGNDVLGVDVDRVALAHAEQTLGIRTLHTDLNGPWDEIPKNPPAGGFDVVVAAEVIEHLYYPEVVLEKIAAVLKPGGMLVGSIPHAFSLQNRMRLVLGTKRGTPLQDPTHINHFWWREFKRLLEKEFVITEIRPILSKKFSWIPIRAAQMPFAHSLLFCTEKKP
ncbi:class I SAM-dependent methyltransferase [Candidatus Kaiserbacteria bacterium]|nr:class I SAM-dependent methyltransferase [Candidatus Kaiserbacteria bacterium]